MPAASVLYVVFILLGCASLPVLAQPAPVQISFGIVPKQAVTEMARLWTPVLAYLSQKTGYSIQFRSAPDIRTFENRVEAGEYDFAYFNPLHYSTYRVNGYDAIAREKDVELTGIVVVRKSSALQELKDLDGTTVAYPSSTAFAATVLPTMFLKQLGVGVTPKYVSSHESVYRTVAHGLYPAGGGIMKTYEQVDPAVRAQLRVLWKSPSFTPHPVAAHQRVPRHVVQLVRDALTAMAKDPHGTAILKASGLKGFIATKDSDYDDIRALSVNIQQGGKVDYGE
jgi:phosphonate transport system substrate-binding protein